MDAITNVFFIQRIAQSLSLFDSNHRPLFLKSKIKKIERTKLNDRKEKTYKFSFSMMSLRLYIVAMAAPTWLNVSVWRKSLKCYRAAASESATAQVNDIEIYSVIKLNQRNAFNVTNMCSTYAYICFRVRISSARTGQVEEIIGMNTFHFIDLDRRGCKCKTHKKIEEYIKIANVYRDDENRKSQTEHKFVFDHDANQRFLHRSAMRWLI